MGESVAGQRAGPREPPGIDIFNAPAGRRICRHHDTQVEVDQTAMVYTRPLASIDAVGIVAHAAWRSEFDDVPAVARKTLIVQNALPTVAAVAQRVRIGTFDGEIGRVVMTCQQRFENRTVWSIGPRSAQGTCVVAIVAIGAGDHASDPKRGDQADHIVVAPRAVHRMVRRVGRLKLQSGIGLADLSRGREPRTSRAVSMALVTYLVEEPGVSCFSPGGRHAGNVQVRPFDRLPQRPAHDPDRVRRCGVRVVAVHALGVSSHGEEAFRRIMDAGTKRRIVSGAFADVGGDVVVGDGTVVAVEAVVLFARLAE